MSKRKQPKGAVEGGKQTCAKDDGTTADAFRGHPPSAVSPASEIDMFGQGKSTVPSSARDAPSLHQAK
jgi:hypothetical protein